MKRILLVSDDIENLSEFKNMVEDEDIIVDAILGLRDGLKTLENRSYNYIFVDDNLLSDGLNERGLTASETLERKARELNSGVVIIEFVSGPQYNRRESLDYSLMKPIHYRKEEMRRILEDA